MLRIAGEIVSQLLNVPILSGAMIFFLFANLPIDLPNRVGGFSVTLVTLGLILFNRVFTLQSQRPCGWRSKPCRRIDVCIWLDGFPAAAPGNADTRHRERPRCGAACCGGGALANNDGGRSVALWDSSPCKRARLGIEAYISTARDACWQEPVHSG